MIDRKRLGRLVGKLNSDAQAERLAAIEAIGKAIKGDWVWLCTLVERGTLPGDAGAREQLFESLVQGRLVEAYAKDWALTTSEKAVLGKVAAAVEGGVAVWDLPIPDLVAAIEVGDEVRRRDKPGPARKWRGSAGLTGW
jgi:hypothetical protein